MRFLLFMDNGNTDHDILVTDWKASFEFLQSAKNYYEAIASRFPYTDDCDYEGCILIENEIKASETVMIPHEPYIQTIHKHGEREFIPGFPPVALIAQLIDGRLSIICRSDKGGWKQE